MMQHCALLNTAHYEHHSSTTLDTNDPPTTPPLLSTTPPDPLSNKHTLSLRTAESYQTRLVRTR